MAQSGCIVNFHGRPFPDPALFCFLMARTQKAILRDLPVWENFSLVTAEEEEKEALLPGMVLAVRRKI